MEVIYGLIPGMVLLGLVTVGVFIWAARSGQFDDMEGDASRILMDEDEEPPLPGDADRRGEAAARSARDDSADEKGAPE